MSQWPLWGVLTPGEPAQLERRARSIVMSDLDQELGKEQPFEVIPGTGRYHAIVGTDPSDVGAELQLAEELSIEGDDPVYSIERANDPWAVMSWRNGAPDVLEVDPDALAKSLGCPLPDRKGTSERAARKPLRTVALIEGAQAEEVRRVLEENDDAPFSPGRYHLESTPRGLLLAGGKTGMNFADIVVSENLPHATIYAVTASPGLNIFSVTRMQAGEGLEEFSQPPDEFPHLSVVTEIKGERSPERILAALGIPAEWFRKEFSEADNPS